LRTRGQDVASVAQNAAFFDENARYAESIATLATYRNIRAAVSTEIAGAERLLDGGNGGVFDYDLGLAPNVVGVDLFLNGTPSGLPVDVELRHGDAPWPSTSRTERMTVRSRSQFFIIWWGPTPSRRCRTFAALWRRPTGSCRPVDDSS
jgi:hypothetical protein